MRDLVDRLYVAALSAYIAIDIWLFHQANRIDDYLTRRGM